MRLRRIDIARLHELCVGGKILPTPLLSRNFEYSNENVWSVSFTSSWVILCEWAQLIVLINKLQLLRFTVKPVIS